MVPLASSRAVFSGRVSCPSMPSPLEARPWHRLTGKPETQWRCPPPRSTASGRGAPLPQGRGHEIQAQMDSRQVLDMQIGEPADAAAEPLRAYRRSRARSRGSRTIPLRRPVTCAVFTLAPGAIGAERQTETLRQALRREPTPFGWTPKGIVGPCQALGRYERIAAEGSAGVSPRIVASRSPLAAGRERRVICDKQAQPGCQQHDGSGSLAMNVRNHSVRLRIGRQGTRVKRILNGFRVRSSASRPPANPD
jgi:hypothetical protein